MLLSLTSTYMAYQSSHVSLAHAIILCYKGDKATYSTGNNLVQFTKTVI